MIDGGEDEDDDSMPSSPALASSLESAECVRDLQLNLPERPGGHSTKSPPTFIYTINFEPIHGGRLEGDPVCYWRERQPKQICTFLAMYVVLELEQEGVILPATPTTHLVRLGTFYTYGAQCNNDQQHRSCYYPLHSLFCLKSLCEKSAKFSFSFSLLYPYLACFLRML